MKIILDENWYITGIPLNYVLMHQRVSYGKGKNAGNARLVEVEEGYYTSIEAALEGFNRKAIKERTEDFEGTIEEYIARIKNINDSAVDRMLKGVKSWEKG